MKKILLKIIESRYIGCILLVMLFLINAYWFHGMSAHTLMGDDLVNWNYYKETPHFVDAVIFNSAFGKYRPVFNIVEFASFRLFDSNFQLFFWFNILFNFLIISVLYSVIKKVANNSNMLAFVGSLLYLTSRFSYYNILQITGMLEALSLFLLILIIYASISFFKEATSKWAYFLLFLNSAIIFTHERFIVITPFIFLILLLGPKITENKKKRLIILSLSFFPMILNIFVKVFIFNLNFFLGAGGEKIKINLLSVTKFLRDGVLNVINFNIGPEYLSGVPFENLKSVVKINSYLILFFGIVLFCLFAMKWIKYDKIERKKELKIFCAFAILISSLLLAASITFRQEFRWLYAPFVVFLIYSIYVFSKITYTKIKYVLLFGILFLSLQNNTNYKKDVDSNVFFSYEQKISDSFYDESIKKYGYQDHNFIIEKFSASDWVIPSELFFKPYIGNNNLIKYVNSVSDIDPKLINKNKTSIYRLNWPERKMEEYNP